MRIRIIGERSFQITEQGDKYFKEYDFSSPIGEIVVASSCYPEVRYMDYKTMVFVRGMFTDKNDNILKVNDPNHMPHILKALEKFCTFNDEPFEIESCIL